MTELFIQLFNMSITAGWMILAVIVVRFLCKRMPKTWHCFLWYLVMLRLLMPVSIESEWSLIPNSKVITEDLLYSQNPADEVVNINITEQMMSSDGPMTDEEKQAKYEAYLEKIYAEEELAQSQTDTEEMIGFSSLWNEFVDFITPDPGASVNPLQVLVYGASYIWLFGMVFMLGYTFISYRRVVKRVKEAVLLKDNIYQSEYVESPFLFGVIKPRIYVPFSLKGEALNCVIAHERTHIKRYDHIVRLLAFLLLTIYWFQPLAWVFYLLLCRDMELACDEMVLKQIGMDKKKLYSQTLLECSVSPKKITVCPLAFGEMSVKQRIKNILNFRKPAVWLVAGTVLLCVILVVCFMTNPVNDGYGTGTTKTEYSGEQNGVETSDISEIENDIPDVTNDMGSLTEQQIEALPEPKNLTEPPTLYLTDPLSSLYSEFAVQPGTYEWSYQTEDGVTGISACGLHPVEVAELANRLNIPDYNGMEDVIYTFGYSVMPDRIEIEEYGIWAMGNAEAEVLEEKVLGGDMYVPLKQNRIYAICAMWDDSKMEERGFYGNAYYTVVTGENPQIEEGSITIFAHAKEIIDKKAGRILISSDSDAYPGAFLLDISENVYDIEEIKLGELMMINMKDTGEMDGKLPVYKAYFMKEKRELIGNEGYTLTDFTITENEPQTPKIDFSGQEPFTEEVNTLEGVTMYMEKYKSTEGDVEIRNEYGKELQYGDWYDIQVQQDGNWYSMPLIIDNAAYHDIAYPVQDQTTSVWEVNWSYFYGELPAGKYRIVKDIIDLREPGDYTKYYLAAEFEIK